MAQPLAQEAVNFASLAQSEEWLAILQYKKSLWGQKSRVKTAEFFLSPNGRTSPHQELESAIEVFSHPELYFASHKEYPNCAFPLRFHFLKRKLHIAFKEFPCEELEKFKDPYDADRVSIIYTSQFVSNPSSVLGHLFMRFHARKREDRIPRANTLDLTVGFMAAIPEGTNFLIYMWNGVVGGFTSFFQTLPFYMKVQEYNNMENRDLWEYELNLTPQEVNSLMDAIWEIQNHAVLQYYFFDENCAFMPLALVKAVKPEWDLTSDSRPFVIPTEVVRTLVLAGAVRKTSYRPSLRVQLIKRISQLSKKETADFYDLTTGKKKSEAIESVPTLDAFLDFGDYRKTSYKGVLPAEMQTKQDHARIQRAKLGSPPIELVFDHLPRPDETHFPYRIGVSTGVANTGGFSELGIRPAIHDLLNREKGFLPNSEIQFMNLTIRWPWRDPAPRLESFTAVSLINLNDFDRLDKMLAWGMRFGVYRPKDLFCEKCIAGLVQGRGGIGSFALGSKQYLYLMAVADLEAGYLKTSSFRFSPGPELGWLGQLSQNLRIYTRGGIHWDLFQRRRRPYTLPASLGLAWAPSVKWDLRLESMAIAGPRTHEITERAYLESALQGFYHF